MHKRRHLFLTVVLVTAVFFAVGYAYFRSSGVQKNLHKALEHELSSQFGGTVDIGEMKIGLLAVTIRDISVSLPLKSVELHIQKIRIGFSLGALLKRDWSPEKLIDETIIISPKLLVTLGTMEDELEEKPLVKTAQQISKELLEALPIRRVGIQECEVVVQTANKRTLTHFTGLNGSLQRENKNLRITLSGAMASSEDNITIDGVISEDMSQQHLSLRTNAVPIASPLLQSNGELTAILNSSLELNFHDAPYPQAVTPDGWFALENIQLIDNEISIIRQGIISIVAENGQIKDKRFYLDFEKNRVIGDLDFSLQKGGDAHLTIKNSDNNQLEVDLLFLTTGPHLATAQVHGEYTLLFGDLSVEGGAHINRQGNRIFLDSLNVSTPFGTGIMTGAYESSWGYRVVTQLNLSHPITPDITAEGKGTITVLGKGLSHTVSGGLHNFLVTGLNHSFLLPSMKLTTKEGTVFLTGIDSLITLKASLADKTYSADLGISEAGIEKLIKTFGGEKHLVSGAYTLSLSGDEDHTLFSTGVSAKTTSYGDLALFGNGTIRKGNLSASIDGGSWKWKGLTLPFSATLHQRDSLWDFNVSDQKKSILASGTVNKESQKIQASSLTLKSFPASWANLFFADDQIPIQNGTISGTMALGGPIKKPVGRGYLVLDQFSFGTEKGLNTTIDMSFNKQGLRIKPFALTTPKDTLFKLDNFFWGDSIKVHGEFDNIRLHKLTDFPGGTKLSGTLRGDVMTMNQEALIFFSSDSLSKEPFTLKNVFGQIRLNQTEISLDTFSFTFEDILGNATFSSPYTLGREDTLKFTLHAQGDILAAADSFPASPIGGSGEGVLNFVGGITDGALFVQKGRLLVPDGTLKVFPYTTDKHLEHFYGDIRYKSKNNIAIKLRGKLERKNLVIKNDYTYDASLEPYKIGGYDFGVLRVFTDPGGIPIYFPGLMEYRRNNVGYVETAGIDKIPAFTISGPPERTKLSGTLLLRKTELTYPLLEDMDYERRKNLFPYITFNLDIRAVDRSVTYFYQLGLKKSRRAPRIIECTIDPSEAIGLRGNGIEETFKIVGGLRSYKGSMFYGNWFDQNFEMGLEFAPEPLPGGGYNNLPIIWGGAETFSDSSRLERVNVKVMTKDPVTGALQSRGRFTELVISPGIVREHLDETDQDGQYQRSLATVEDAGDMVTGIGDKYISSYFFNYWGRQLARKIGLDMIRIESSMMNNSFSYLHQRSLDSTFATNWEQIAFANTGITVGKYLGGSDFFLKWRTEFGTQDSILVPEYKIGLEYQPIPYLWMDFNYGLSKDAYTDELLVNPEVRLQLRVPISGKKSQD